MMYGQQNIKKFYIFPYFQSREENKVKEILSESQKSSQRIHEQWSVAGSCSGSYTSTTRRQPNLLKDRVWTLLLYSRIQSVDNFTLVPAFQI
jgi:hypothetical protein